MNKDFNVIEIDDFDEYIKVITEQFNNKKAKKKKRNRKKKKTQLDDSFEKMI